LPAPYKATRRVAGAGNVGEAGVGASVATDLADRTLAALAAYGYNPVMRRSGVLYIFLYSFIIFSFI